MFSPGDRVKYLGKKLGRLTGLAWLRIESIEGDVVIVKGDGWQVTRKVPVSEIQLVERAINGK
jgi:hypothetical protein